MTKPVVVAALGLAGALGATAPASAQSAPAAAYNCTPGYFCMYSGWKGGGHRCQYRDNTPNTADACSFIRAGEPVRSVWNGTGKTATYYTNTNYHHRVGSTKPGHGGNLQGDYQIRSIKF
ncbi:peptidase inhibitor family I36 protein [Gandjariella thermophila]|uniref:peptidase inhibitor family I36 protein n=1 Tax=Gandjariella thermophila TaxID=1931992 RepID=UPI001CEF8906|nr:peptidase inhibitor family I36 protein [Gandjariella thermophila]